RRMIPHMLDGTWTLEQVGRLLSPSANAARPSVAAATTSAQATTSTSKNQSPSTKPKPETSKLEQATLPLEPTPGAGKSGADPALRSRRETNDVSSGFNLRPWLLGGVAAAIVCVIVIWHFVSAKPAQAGRSQAQVQPALSSASQPIPPRPAEPAAG